MDSNRPYAQVLAESIDGVVDVGYHYGDDLISQTRASDSHYFHVDGLGSSRVLTDDAGAETDRYGYKAFGELLSQEGVTDNSHLYTGEQYDPNTENYYLRARYYDPSRPGFLIQDTWAGASNIPLSLNKYAYGNDDPVNNIDPTGNFSIGAVMSAVSTMAILTTVASTSYDITSSLISGDSVSAKDIGFAVLIGRTPGGGKLLKNIARKLCSKIKCKIPVVDTKHIFYGEVKKRTAQGFHSTALTSYVHGAGVSIVEQVLWKRPNGVYKAWVNVADTKTGRYRRKKSTMFPDSWSESYVGASLYLSWIRNRSKQKGILNVGLIKIQHFVKDGLLLRGYPL